MNDLPKIRTLLLECVHLELKIGKCVLASGVGLILISITYAIAWEECLWGDRMCTGVFSCTGSANVCSMAFRLG